MKTEKYQNLEHGNPVMRVIINRTSSAKRKLAKK